MTTIAADASIVTVDPSSGDVLAEYQRHDADQVHDLLHRADAACHEWRHTPIHARSLVIRDIGRRLERERDECALRMVREMGKPIVQAESEVDKCIRTCDFFADQAADFLRPETVASSARQSLVRFDPLGVILGVMPWNFPFWQVFRFAIPTLLAGNVVVVKHATNVTGTALAIGELFSGPGVPADLLTVLLIESKAVQDLIAHPSIRGVSLTGSERAGRSVAEAAGRHLKKSVLELGGSDPFLVLADADLQATAKQAVQARNQNTGQSCIAAKRFIVADRIYHDFLEAFLQSTLRLKVGEPANRDTDVGPLAREDLRDQLHSQVQRSVEAGARMVCGGEPLSRAGFFYKPTILADVEPGMPAFDEELFGPVAAVIRARNENHAVELANQSQFGLGASIWTASPERALELAASIEAGVVFINGVVRSDPSLPFGGIKNSGFGRELGVFGIREFVNVKTVWSE